MALDTYDNLKDAIAEWLERSDLTNQIDDFIDIAEARHKRQIRIREMRTREYFGINDRLVDVPTGFVDLKYLRIQVPNVTSGRRFLPQIEQLTLDELTQISVLDERRPLYFALHDRFEFDSEPDQLYDGEILFYTELDPLSSTNTTNALLDRAGDLYLWSALAASAPFLMHDERIAVWEQLYQQGVQELNQLERESRRGGPVVSRITGVAASHL